MVSSFSFAKKIIYYNEKEVPKQIAIVLFGGRRPTGYLEWYAVITLKIIAAWDIRKYVGLPRV